MMPGEKAQDFKGSLRQLVNYLRPYWLILVTVLLFSVGSTVFSIIGPKLMGQATNELVAGLMAKMQKTGQINFDGKINCCFRFNSIHRKSFAFQLHKTIVDAAKPLFNFDVARAPFLLVGLDGVHVAGGG